MAEKVKSATVAEKAPAKVSSAAAPAGAKSAVAVKVPVKSVAAKPAPAKKSAAKRRVSFEIDAGPGKTVSVAGTFNDWNPDAKPLADKDGSGVYRGAVMLEPGRYEYKFVVDGIWSMDARNPNFAPNDFGTLNSLLIVE